MTICPAACASVLRGACAGTAIGIDLDAIEAIVGIVGRRSRSSRHIFQHTHSSSTPPANSSPTILRSCVGDAGKADAQHGGGDDADQDGLGALLLRQARGGKADDDGIVAGQSTRSIMMTWASAASASAEKSSS